MTKEKNAIDLLLAESLKELAQKQPIEKITIKQITDKAGVIRPTFYNHFQDKYELLEWIVSVELLEPVEPLVQNGMINEALMLLFSKIEKEKEFYMKACRLEGQNSFESIAQKCVERILLELINASGGEKRRRYAWLTPERIVTYYAQSMCYVVGSWIRSGMTISAKELAEIFNYMMRYSMMDVLSGKADETI